MAKRLRKMTTYEKVCTGLKVVAGVAYIAVAIAVGYAVYNILDNAHQRAIQMEQLEVQRPTIEVVHVAQPKAVMPELVLPKVESKPVEVVEPVEDIYEQEAQPATTMTYWADARVTAYCPCEKCCGKYARNRPTDENGKPIVHGASGAQLVSYKSCASSLPFGTKLYVADIDQYFVVEDRAAKSIDSKYNGKYVDIYIDDHDACYEFLRGKNAYMEVYIVE